MTSGVELPAAFRFGVATAGYQVEGGYNGTAQPANNWRDWEVSGRVEPSGTALGFWDHFEEHIERAAAVGIDSFRLSVEWARCEPLPGQPDPTAIERYASILRCCREHGLEPLVTLCHFTHPAWLGERFWLDRDSPQQFAEWVEGAVNRLGSLCSQWVTINEINILAEQSYLTGSYPPGRRGDIAAAVGAIDNLLTAHVLAYERIHASRPGMGVTTNNSSSSVYELDRLLVDVLVARMCGVSRLDVHEWLSERRSRYYTAVARGRMPSVGERLMRRLVATAVPLERAFPRALAAVYASPFEVTLDSVALDYYDPVAAHAIRVPGYRTAGGRCWAPYRQLWDVPPNPSGLVAYCGANQVDGLALWVVENGIASRVAGGKPHYRRDGWDRIRYLRENLGAVVAAVDSGIPVEGYWHWTLADNYEWGSYEPRFGLFGVDRSDPTRWSDLDSMGGDSAGAYRRLIAGLRDGDRAVLVS